MSIHIQNEEKVHNYIYYYEIIFFYFLQKTFFELLSNENGIEIEEISNQNLENLNYNTRKLNNQQNDNNTLNANDDKKEGISKILMVGLCICVFTTDMSFLIISPFYPQEAAKRGISKFMVKSIFKISPQTK